MIPLNSCYVHSLPSKLSLITSTLNVRTHDYPFPATEFFTLFQSKDLIQISMRNQDIRETEQLSEYKQYTKTMT